MTRLSLFIGFASLATVASVHAAGLDADRATQPIINAAPQ